MNRLAEMLDATKWVTLSVAVVVMLYSIFKWVWRNATETAKEEISNYLANLGIKWMPRTTHLFAWFFKQNIISPEHLAKASAAWKRHDGLTTKAQRWIRRRFSITRSQRSVFTTRVARSISAFRAKQIIFLISILLFVAPSVGLPWPLLIPILLLTVDFILLVYRQKRGMFGNNSLEFGEAVRYVLDEKRSGRGPGHFSRVFPEHVVRTEDVLSGVPVRPGI